MHSKRHFFEVEVVDFFLDMDLNKWSLEVRELHNYRGKNCIEFFA